MGNDDNRILKINQKLLQPADRLQIQMVGRLVEQQDIRISEQRLRQQHLHLLAAVQLRHQLIVQLRLNAQTIQQRSRVRFRLPAVQRGKITLQLARTNAVLLRKILLRIDGVLFLHNLVQPLISHNYGGKHLEGVVFKVILLEERQALSRRNDNLALARLDLAG